MRGAQATEPQALDAWREGKEPMAVRAVAVLLALATATMAADRSSALQRLVNSSERVVQARLRVDRTEKLCMQRSDSVAVNLVVTYVDVEPTDYVTGESGDRPTLRLLGGFWGGYAFVDTDGTPPKKRTLQAAALTA